MRLLQSLTIFLFISTSHCFNVCTRCLNSGKILYFHDNYDVQCVDKLQVSLIKSHRGIIKTARGCKSAARLMSKHGSSIVTFSSTSTTTDPSNELIFNEINLIFPQERTFFSSTEPTQSSASTVQDFSSTTLLSTTKGTSIKSFLNSSAQTPYIPRVDSSTASTTTIKIPEPSPRDIPELLSSLMTSSTKPSFLSTNVPQLLKSEISIPENESSTASSFIIPTTTESSSSSLPSTTTFQPSTTTIQSSSVVVVTSQIEKTPSFTSSLPPKTTFQSISFVPSTQISTGSQSTTTKRIISKSPTSSSFLTSAPLVTTTTSFIQQASSPLESNKRTHSLHTTLPPPSSTKLIPQGTNFSPPQVLTTTTTRLPMLLLKASSTTKFPDSSSSMTTAIITFKSSPSSSTTIATKSPYRSRPSASPHPMYNFYSLNDDHCPPVNLKAHQLRKWNKFVNGTYEIICKSYVYVEVFVANFAECKILSRFNKASPVHNRFDDICDPKLRETIIYPSDDVSAQRRFVRRGNKVLCQLKKKGSKLGKQFKCRYSYMKLYAAFSPMSGKNNYCEWILGMSDNKPKHYDDNDKVACYT